MQINFNEVDLLENSKIIDEHRGYRRCLYSADFNVSEEEIEKGLKGEKVPRIDSEIEDMQQIVNTGGKLVILAHQGRFKDNTARSLEFIVPYLSKKLGVNVQYYPDNNNGRDFRAVVATHDAKPGEAIVMGNSRLNNEGEEKGDVGLAARFSRLGDNMACGGFGKAHRKHASNYRILEFKKGYLTRSQKREMEKLAPFLGRQKNSVAVLGGAKKEKITEGLVGLSETYEHIIAGGIVLNTLLHVQEHRVGSSILADKEAEQDAIDMLKHSKANIHFIPRQLLIARKTDYGYRDLDFVDITKKDVPEGFMIVSYLMSKDMIEALDRVIEQKGRLVLAGTPDLYKEGLGLATNEVVERLKKVGREGLVLGEDTSSEIDYDAEKHHGTVSTGGGSALYFLRRGTTPVFEFLKWQNNTDYKVKV